jgi:hypothetical protein
MWRIHYRLNKGLRTNSDAGSFGQARVSVAHATPVHSGTEHTTTLDRSPSTTVRVARPQASRTHLTPPSASGEPTAVRLPAIRPDTRPSAARLSAGFRRAPLQSGMSAMTIVIMLEIKNLHLQVGGRPEERPVQAFAPNGADQPCDEGMRTRHAPHSLDFFHVGVWPRVARSNIRHRPTPSTAPRCTPKLAPQAGFEPATLRLTAGFQSSCCVLPGFAACCCL